MSIEAIRAAVDEAVTAAYNKYRTAVLKEVVRTLVSISKKDPEALLEYSAGMGHWGFVRTSMVYEEDGSGEGYEYEDSDYEPEPAFSIVQEAYNDYDMNCIPEGILRVKGGKIIENDLV